MEPSPTELERWLEFAVDTARAAGRLIVEHYERPINVESKSNPHDLVTEADRASEAAIIEAITSTFPAHALVAEESGSVTQGEGVGAYRWFVDPLDGTTNFAHGVGHFSVVLACYAGATGLVGVVHDPIRQETFAARKGGGAQMLAHSRGTARSLRVSVVEAFGSSLLATGFPYHRSRSAPLGRANLQEFNHVMPHIRGIRRAGSAALDLAYVAAGRLDGYWEYDLSPWDWGAGAVLVREGGGHVVRIDGADWVPGDTTVVAGGAEIVRSLRGILSCGALK